jgi:23S rRNA pseudouridine2605 synthase/23S rRNA pseudouridine2604 synthase
MNSTKLRLQKYIANTGYCSRRKAEELILKGKIKVNNEYITVLGTKIDPETDEVYIDDKKIEPEKRFVYIILNKPPGYVSSCSHKGKKTVIDLIDTKERVYPVGRLDMYSRGLILLTNDGELHNRMSHPSFDHEKEYLVEISYPFTDKELKKLKNGIEIEGKKTRPAVIRKKEDLIYSFILKEGRNRQIRKMVKAVNKKVKDLKRIRTGSLKLGNLKQGEWRFLTDKEINNLKKS